MRGGVVGRVSYEDFMISDRAFAATLRRSSLGTSSRMSSSRAVSIPLSPAATIRWGHSELAGNIPVGKKTYIPLRALILIIIVSNFSTCASSSSSSVIP